MRENAVNTSIWQFQIAIYIMICWPPYTQKAQDLVNVIKKYWAFHILQKVLIFFVIYHTAWFGKMSSFCYTYARCRSIVVEYKPNTNQLFPHRLLIIGCKRQLRHKNCSTSSALKDVPNSIIIDQSWRKPTLYKLGLYNNDSLMVRESLSQSTWVVSKARQESMLSSSSWRGQQLRELSKFLCIPNIHNSDDSWNTSLCHFFATCKRRDVSTSKRLYDIHYVFMRWRLSWRCEPNHSILAEQ